MHEFPNLSYADLARRIDAVPAGTRFREWTLRDDKFQHYHGVVRLSESPMFLRLFWKATAGDKAQLLGTYRLNLRALLENGFVRMEYATDTTEHIRLRFVRAQDDVVFVETRPGEPRLAIARVIR